MAGRYPVIADSKVIQFPTTEDPKDDQISDEEAFNIAAQSRPRGMSRREQKIWETDIPAYVKINRFKSHFIRFFKEYCVVIARMEFNKGQLDSEGWTYTTNGRNGTQHKIRPEAAQYNDDFRKLNSLINQIGGSPATDQRFNHLQPSLFDELY